VSLRFATVRAPQVIQSTKSEANFNTENWRKGACCILGLWWGCAFPSLSTRTVIVNTSSTPVKRFAAAQSLSASFFNLLFPDNCRLCQQPLRGPISRIPVCLPCLSLPQPLQADHFCIICRTPFVNSYPLDEHGQCTVCRENQANFDSVYSFGSYQDSLQQLINLFKYSKIESLAQPLSRLLVRALPLDQSFDVVIAMPMHWRKRWERGFNQSELLAAPIAKRFGLKLAGNLRRSRYTAPQASLSEAARHANLRNSFKVLRPEQIFGRHVLLVDDVFTTGATLRAATAVLKTAGAARVSALTLARVDRRSFDTNSVVRPSQKAGKTLAARQGSS
jgi:ComF family protein